MGYALNQDDLDLLAAMVTDAYEYRRSYNDEPDEDDVRDDAQAEQYEVLAAKLRGLTDRAVRVQHPHPTQEHDVTVNVALNDDGSVSVTVLDPDPVRYGNLEVGAIDLSVDALVREATETSPPLTWLAAALNELGLEGQQGREWMLNGSGADHAAILYDLIGRLGWWPPLLDPDAELTVTCPTDPLQEDGEPHTIIGCGATFTVRLGDVHDAFDDGDGAIDCPECGMFLLGDERIKMPRIGPR